MNNIPGILKKLCAIKILFKRKIFRKARYESTYEKGEPVGDLIERSQTITEIRKDISQINYNKLYNIIYS